MTAFHQDLFRSVVLYFAALAVWGFYLWWRRNGANGSYLAALIIGEGLAIVQGLSGLLLVATNHHPKDGLHWLYGFVIILTLPVVYGAWAQNLADDRKSALFYGLGCSLIVVIAVVRSAQTG